MACFPWIMGAVLFITGAHGLVLTELAAVHPSSITGHRYETALKRAIRRIMNPSASKKAISRLTVERLKTFAWLMLATTLGGLLFAHLAPGDEGSNYGRAAFNWALGGAAVWWFEIFFIPSRWGMVIRRMHFISALLVKALILLGIILAVIPIVRIIHFGSFDPALYLEPRMIRATIFAFLLAAVLVAITQIIRLVGSRELINFILGRYHHPVEVRTVFMFLDLVGSTALAERMGDVGVQAMITRFFFDIAQPIREFGGETHRYVGDQVVVTWPYVDDQAPLQAIECYFAIAERLHRLESNYRRDFGAVPGFRIGVHGGHVVISECGDDKQELVYFGDTVNMAARIEQQCKTFDCNFLISGDLLENCRLPDHLQAVKMGAVQLRGRQNETELFMVTRVDAHP